MATGSEMMLSAGEIYAFDPTAASSTPQLLQKAKIIRALNAAKDITVQRLKFLNLKTSTFSTTNGTMIYTPFADLDQILVMRETTSNRWIQRVSAHDFYSHVPNPTATGNPFIYIDDLGPDTGGIKQIGLYNIPSSTLTIRCIYRAISFNLTGTVDYTTGTASISNGATAVTGSGTTWTDAMVGRYFRIDGDQRWYKISARGSNTSITLASAFQGTTASTAAYTIAERYALKDQDETPDMLINLKAKHLLAQGDRQYAEMCVELSREYELQMKEYRAALDLSLDGIDQLMGENANNFFPFKSIGDLSSYDILQ